MATACIMETKKRFSQNFDTRSIREELITYIGYDVERMDEQKYQKEILIHQPVYLSM